MSLKDFFYYVRSTRVAVVVLLALIILVLTTNIILLYRQPSEVVVAYNDSIIAEFSQFKDSIKLVDNVGNRTKYDRSYVLDNNSKFNAYHKEEKTYYNSSEIDSTAPLQTTASYPTDFERVEKLSEGQTISINEKDTTVWKKIPGIGSTFAKRITKYSDLLGGYVSKHQLKEVYGIDEDMFSRIEKYIIEDEGYQKLAINTLEFKELLRHPYLNYEQVKAVVNLRQKKGNIKSAAELAMLSQFTKDDITRLEPYLSF